MVGYYKNAPKEDEVLLEEIPEALIVTMNLDLSSHQRYLMKVQRDADHIYYLTKAREAGWVSPEDTRKQAERVKEIASRCLVEVKRELEEENKRINEAVKAEGERIREAVEGAGLTDDMLRAEYESWLDLDPDENQIKGLREVAKSMKQAALKALGGE